MILNTLILFPGCGTFSCNGGSGLKPDPTDCSKFYQCAHGKATRTSCAQGTWFDPSLKNCNWIANVKKSPCLDCKNKAATTTKKTTTTAATTTKKATTTAATTTKKTTTTAATTTKKATTTAATTTKKTTTTAATTTKKTTTTAATTTTKTTTTATTRKSGCGKHYTRTKVHVFNQDITN